MKLSDIVSQITSEARAHGAAVNSLTSVAVFWAWSQLGQRLCGPFKIQYGRRGSFAAGLVIVLSGSVVSQVVQRTYVAPLVETSAGRLTTPLTREELVGCSYLSALSFLALGLKSFGAVLPSSLIELGSFRKVPHFPIPGRGSLAVDGDTASPAHRARMQRLGTLYGCHQCGSRQIFGQGKGAFFISDHMPPTQQVKIENKKRWRQFLRLKLKQELWPQCQKCFSQQGTAVRLGNHVSIYNTKLRPHHLCVLAAQQAYGLASVRWLLDPAVQDALFVADEAAAVCRNVWQWCSGNGC